MKELLAAWAVNSQSEEIPRRMLDELERCRAVFRGADVEEIEAEATRFGCRELPQRYRRINALKAKSTSKRVWLSSAEFRKQKSKDKKDE